MKQITKNEARQTSGGIFGEINFVLNVAIPFLQYVGVVGGPNQGTINFLIPTQNKKA